MTTTRYKNPATRAAAPARPRDTGDVAIGLRRDAAGDPLVSATFVLTRAPAPDERLSPLIERAVIALDLELVPAGGPESPAGETTSDTGSVLVDGVTFELVRRAAAVPPPGIAVGEPIPGPVPSGPGADTVVAEQHTSGPFAHGAIQAAVAGGAAVELLEALVGGGRAYEVVVRAELPAPPGPPTQVRVALGQLWSHLDAAADDTRRFYRMDLLNYLPDLIDDGIVQVEQGGDRPESVLSALLRGARFALEPAPYDAEAETDPALGPAYILSAYSPGDTEAVSTEQMGGGGGPIVERRIDLGALVVPAIAHDRARFVHLVSTSGGQIDAVLPARAMRATRGEARSTVYVARGDRIPSMEATLHSKPVATHLAVGAQLHATVLDRPNILHMNDLELIVADRPERRPGPVVADVDAPLWTDRWANDRKWYVPEFVIVRPDPSVEVDSQSPFRFDVEPAGGHTAEGTTGIIATITVTLESRRSDATVAAWEAAGQPRLDLAPLSGLSVQIGIPFRDENGTTRVEYVTAENVDVTGTLGADGGRVVARFRLLDKWARLAYGALSTADFQTEPCRVLVAASIEGWRAHRDRPIILGLDKRWALSRFSTDSVVTRDLPDLTRGPGLTRRPGAVLEIDRIHELPVAAAEVHPVWQVHPELVAEIDRTQYDWSRFATSRSITAFFSCAELGSNYRELVDDVEWQAIGCRAALQLGQTEYRTYEEIAVTAAAGEAKVYRSLRSPGRFLVVPTTYAVGRFEPDDGDQAYRPAILLHSTIDIDHPTNIRCVLAASLQPHLPPFRRAAIVEELRRTAHPAPVLEYLPDCGVTPEISWAIPSHTEVECIPTASGFDVVCSTDPAGFLALKSMLERDGVRGSAVVRLPGGLRLSTALLLGLTSVTGPFEAGPIDLGPTRDGRLDIENRTGQRIAVKALAADGVEVAQVGQAVAANATVSVEHPNTSGQLDAVYEADRTPESLEEIRAYIEDLELGIVFVSTSDPATAGLAGLEIHTKLADQVDAEPLVLTSAKREAERSYLLPLTAFAADPVLEFTVTAVGADGTRHTAEPVNWPVRSRGELVPVGPPPTPPA